MVFILQEIVFRQVCDDHHATAGFFAVGAAGCACYDRIPGGSLDETAACGASEVAVYQKFGDALADRSVDGRASSCAVTDAGWRRGEPL